MHLSDARSGTDGDRSSRPLRTPDARRRALRRRGIAAVVVLAMVCSGVLTGGLDSWDRSIGPAHGVGGSGVWLVVAGLGARWLTLPVMVVATMVLRRRTGRRGVVGASAVTLAALTGTVIALKWGVGRTPPGAVRHGLHAGGASFPSGHVVNAVVGWGMAIRACAWSARRALILGAGAGAIVAMGVVVVGWHWPTDAVAGEALGVALLAGWLLATDRNGTDRTAIEGSPTATSEPARETASLDPVASSHDNSGESTHIVRLVDREASC